MAEFGIFFVPVGELECWLSELGIAKNKTHWLSRMFKEIGSDPAAEDYLNAGQNDVWEFIRGVERWIANPSRLGIPS